MVISALDIKLTLEESSFFDDSKQLLRCLFNGTYTHTYALILCVCVSILIGVKYCLYYSVKYQNVDIISMTVAINIHTESISVFILMFQLVKCCEERLIFEDFQEGRITFPPTYKFDVGTDNYDSRLVKGTG